METQARISFCVLCARLTDTDAGDIARVTDAAHVIVAAGISRVNFFLL